MRRLTGLLMAGGALLVLVLSVPAPAEQDKAKPKDTPDSGKTKSKDTPDTGKTRSKDTPDAGKTRPKPAPDTDLTNPDIGNDPDRTRPGAGGDSGKGKPSAGKPPHRVYAHTTLSGRKCKFDISGERGKAEYYWNGQKQNEDLTFTRSAKMNETMPGWVFKAGKQNIWFFFASSPRTQAGGQTGGKGATSKDYPVFYTQSPPGPDGKQRWTLCPTQSGTTVSEGAQGGGERSEEPDTDR